MKRVSSLLLLCMLTTSLFAQKVTSGSLSSLKDSRTLNVKIDFSQADIHGMNEATYAEYEKDWNKDKPAVIESFIKGANLSSKKDLMFGQFSSGKYTLLIKVKVISDDYRIFTSADIIDSESNVIATIDDLNIEKKTLVRLNTDLGAIKVRFNLLGMKLGKFLRDASFAGER